MKQFICIVVFLLFFTAQSANAMTFEQAFAELDSKPAVVLIYAQWADAYQSYLAQFKALQPKFKNYYNFVELDVASKDMKAFNTRYNIYQNLPYIMVYRNRGKMTKYIPNNRAASYSST